MREHIYVPAMGPVGAKLMILGEAPSYEETAAGKPFVGPSGRELDKLLKDAKISRHNCWVSNVCKYEVPPNAPGGKIPFAVRAHTHGINVQQQLVELQAEINQLKPNCILALGGTALWALSGKDKITNYRGSILHGMGSKFVPSFHPAHLLHQATGGEIKGYWNRQVMIHDFKRALAQSEFPDMRLPSRTLQICRSYYDLWNFFDTYRKQGFRKLAVDIEAANTCIPVCMGFAFTPHHGITVPLWNCDGISTISDAEMTNIWILIAQVLIEFDIVGQNFNYDRDKIKRLGFIIRKLIDDIMLKSHAINPELPKGLAFNTSIFTEEPFYKDEGMYEGSLQDLFTGCARDSCVTIEINQKMDKDIDEYNQRRFYENFLMRLPDLYWAIEQQGFRVDTNIRDGLLLPKYIEWDERLRYELFTLVGAEINVNAPKQIATLLWDNLKLPRKATTGEEDITALLNSPTAVKSPEHRRICELILEDRRVRKSISTYLMALPDYDERMRTTYFPCLDTGRSSTGQQDPPIRPKVEIVDEQGKKKTKVLGTAFQTMTKHGDIGSDIRAMYVPDASHIELVDTPYGVIKEVIEEDEVFIQADSSQAEARVVWLLADDEEALEQVDKIDYHAHTAVWFFGPNAELCDYDKKKLGYEHPIRFCGKTLRHAGHLGASKRRASIEVNTQARKYKIPIKIDEATAERALHIFHAKQPKIRQVFQASVIDCITRTRQLIAPVPYGVDAEIGGIRTFFERWGDELFRQGFSYLPQRAVSDNTKAAALRIRERIPRIKIAMESHDALLFSVPSSKVRDYSVVIKEEMERPIDFTRCSISRRKLCIPCEIETGLNYKDMSKFKDIPIIAAPREQIVARKKTITEEFLATPLPSDSRLDNTIYNDQEYKDWRRNN